MELVMEQEAPAGEVCLTPEAMDAYLDTLRQQGRSADTLAAYRRSIYGLYRSLPPDKRVGRGTLDRWRETLEDQGYLPRTINVRLAEELRGYAARQGITAGPVFRSRNGQPMRRTQVTGEIRSLCRDARVPEEKGNPRCLRRLWQKTQDAIRISVDQLVVQAFDQMMEAEQFSVGWDAGKGVGMM